MKKQPGIKFTNPGMTIQGIPGLEDSIQVTTRQNGMRPLGELSRDQIRSLLQNLSEFIQNNIPHGSRFALILAEQGDDGIHTIRAANSMDNPELLIEVLRKIANEDEAQLKAPTN